VSDERFFLTDLRCADGATSGRCILNDVMALMLAPPQLAECWADAPDSVRQAETLALWDSTDEDGQEWVLVCDADLVFAAVRPDPDAPQWVRSWWLDDTQLSREAFGLLCRKETLVALLQLPAA
jgi:hypothetical protein